MLKGCFLCQKELKSPQGCNRQLTSLVGKAVFLLAIFLVAVIKYSDKQQLKGEKVYLGPEFKVQFIMAEKSRRQELEAAGHLHPQPKSREQ